jgi:hypothetical protein
MGNLSIFGHRGMWRKNIERRASKINKFTIMTDSHEILFYFVSVHFEAAKTVKRKIKRKFPRTH